MPKVTIELTLDQLIEAARDLSPEEQLKLISSLLRDNQFELDLHVVEEEREAGAAGEFTEEQLREEVLRLVGQVRTRYQANPGQRTTPLKEFLADFTTGQDLTVFTDLDDDDFQA